MTSAEQIAEEGANEVGAPLDCSPAGPPTHRRATSAADILQAVDIDEVDVDVPEWGLVVRVRGISRAEYRAIEKLSTDPATGETDAELADVHLLVAGMLEPRVTVEEATAIVNGKSIPSVGKVTKAIMEASGLGAGFQA